MAQHAAACRFHYVEEAVAGDERAVGLLIHRHPGGRWLDAWRAHEAAALRVEQGERRAGLIVDQAARDDQEAAVTRING